MDQRTIEMDGPLAFHQTLSPLQQGRRDPCVTWHEGALWRSSRSPDGPFTMQVQKIGDSVMFRSWGPGSHWALERADDLVGFGQDCSPFEHDLLDEIHRRMAGVRIPKTHAVFETLVFVILAQRVTTMEAKSSWRQLVTRFGDVAPVAPGGPRLLLPPSPEQIIGLPSWAFHRLNVERKRAEAIRLAARCARRLDEAGSLSSAEAFARITALPGIGAWTAAETALVALGDTDAVSVGDYHLADQIGWALARQTRSTDEEMLDLLEPFRPRRGLAARLIICGHPRPPAFGPRYSPLPLASM